ncbi:caspase-7-like [Argopecten irradians]|uniref:caspase-7-like n=1 Tax=Argopecten irradians TaxID=31199 RepID=UPI00371AE793
MGDQLDGSGDQAVQTRTEFEGQVYSYKKYIGKALIVNNKDFKGPEKAKKQKTYSREGSENDVQAIRQLLDKLGFEIQEEKNLTKSKLKETIHDLASRENYYKDVGCFLCVIMSFGEPGIIICPGEENRKDERLEIKEIQAPFTGEKCKALATRPKIYFIMGNENYEEDDQSDGPGIEMRKPETRKIPRECNFLTQCSHESDHGNWKEKKPSPYISAVIEAFTTHVVNLKETGEDLDVLKVMTRINGIMVDKDAKIPLVTSLLTKRHHFRTTTA